MQREIKFRVWCEESECFIGATSSDWVGSGCGNVGGTDKQPWKCMSFKGQMMSNDNMGGFVDSNQSNYIIQQYTGLKDKNDKEIYEGDIVKTEFGHMFSSNIHVVEYIKNRFVPDDVCDTDGVEVIGNIFESLDLVK
jgi:hypothetical protein